MCWWEIAAIGLTAAQAISSGVAAKQEGDAQAAIAAENAKNYRRQALDAERRGAESAYSAIRSGREAIAAQELAMAANNVDSTSGSMADLISNTAGMSVYDAAIAISNAEREAYGHYVQEADAKTHASMYKQLGKNKMIASLLGGGAQTAGMGQKYFGKTYPASSSDTAASSDMTKKWSISSGSNLQSMSNNWNARRLKSIGL